MCLIIVKPKGVTLPPKNTLRLANKANSDGFGMAYTSPGSDTVTIHKGAMTEPEMLKMVSSVSDPTERTMILHWRIATEGKVCPGNCHPYPITILESEVKETTIECKVALAHNGIAYVGGAHTGLRKDEPLSDTQKFILACLGHISTGVFNPGVVFLIKKFSPSSKFALLSSTRCIAIGNFIEDEGRLYSNASYKSPPPVRVPLYSAPYSGSYLWSQATGVEMTSQTCSICGKENYVMYKILSTRKLVCVVCENELPSTTMTQKSTVIYKAISQKHYERGV